MHRRRESVCRLGHSPRLSLGGICIAGTFPFDTLRRPPVEKDSCSGEIRITPVSLLAQALMRGSATWPGNNFAREPFSPYARGWRRLQAQARPSMDFPPTDLAATPSVRVSRHLPAHM